MLEALVDNDVVEKTARWQCIGEMPLALSVNVSSIGYLQSLRYVVGKRLQRLASVTLVEHFEMFLKCASPVEPTMAELELAAEIETLSIEGGLALDVGESLLISVALKRSQTKIATGDKRAICSCVPLSVSLTEVKMLKGCMVSLEQILAKLLAVLGKETLRARVCSDANADKTARICFACARCDVTEEEIYQALASYQGDLARMSDGYSTNELCC